MDTRVNIRVYPGSVPADWQSLADRAFALFAAYERRFSLFSPTSEICEVNARAGQVTVVSDQFFRMLKYALAVADETEGVFDPSVGRWTAPRFPVSEKIISTYRDIRLSEAERTVQLSPNSVLDLNAVVKGSAIDDVIAIFIGADAVIVEAGGDIAVKGLPPGKAAWNIAIRNPRSPREASIILPVTAGAVCTSGDYLRGRSARLAGRVHLAGARDGRTAHHHLSMTVLAPTAREADTLSTAAFLLPPEKAAEFVESHVGASCLFIDHAGQVFVSPRLNSVILQKIHA